MQSFYVMVENVSKWTVPGITLYDINLVAKRTVLKESLTNSHSPLSMVDNLY